jgi:hypothetical protein
VEPRVQGGSALAQRLPRKRVVPVRAVEVHHGRDLVAGRLELGNVWQAIPTTRRWPLQLTCATGSRSASYDIPIHNNFKVTTSVFYNAQSGRPYTDLFSGDPNGDGRTTNDLLYVPRSADEIILQNGTWDQLNTYIENDPALAPYRGQIVGRNVARSPWVNSVDFRMVFNVPAGRRFKAEVTLDVLNFINIFGKNYGQASRELQRPAAALRRVDAATGSIYDIGT